MADSDSVKVALGGALRAAIADAGTTQVDLADAIGWSRSAIGQWVTGQNMPPLDAIARMDEVLGPPSLLVRSGLVSVTVVEATHADPALDDDGHRDVMSAYRRAIGDTARRRLALTAYPFDEDDTLPAEVLFGPDWPFKVEEAS